MFDFNGTLIDGSSGWQVNFIDEEGDMLLIGDQPWQLSIKTLLIIAHKNSLSVH